MNCSAITSPTANPLLCDRCSTNQPSAIVCIHVPHCDTIWPKKKSRKLRMCSDLNVAPVALHPASS